MIKLYRRDGAGVLHYHEAWADGRKIVEHWGVVGETGDSRKHRRPATVDSVLTAARAQGFAELDDEQAVWLEVQYDLDGWGGPRDLDLRNAVEAHLNEALGWAGVGHCDGGSIGSGAMEIACVVVDEPIGRRVIETALGSSRFPPYSRINAD